MTTIDGLYRRPWWECGGYGTGCLDSLGTAIREWWWSDELTSSSSSTALPSPRTTGIYFCGFLVRTIVVFEIVLGIVIIIIIVIITIVVLPSHSFPWVGGCSQTVWDSRCLDKRHSRSTLKTLSQGWAALWG